MKHSFALIGAVLITAANASPNPLFARQTPITNSTSNSPPTTTSSAPLVTGSSGLYCDQGLCLVDCWIHCLGVTVGTWWTEAYTLTAATQYETYTIRNGSTVLLNSSISHDAKASAFLASSLGLYVGTTLTLPGIPTDLVGVPEEGGGYQQDTQLLLGTVATMTDNRTAFTSPTVWTSGCAAGTVVATLASGGQTASATADLNNVTPTAVDPLPSGFENLSGLGEIQPSMGPEYLSDIRAVHPTIPVESMPFDIDFFYSLTAPLPTFAMSYCTGNIDGIPGAHVPVQALTITSVTVLSANLPSSTSTPNNGGNNPPPPPPPPASSSSASAQAPPPPPPVTTTSPASPLLPLPSGTTTAAGPGASGTIAVPNPGETTTVIGGSTQTSVVGGSTTTQVQPPTTQTTIDQGVTRTTVLPGSTTASVVGGDTITQVTGGITQTFTTSASAIIIGGSTLSAGGPAIIISSTTFSFEPSGTGIVINGNTTPLGQATVVNPGAGQPIATPVTGGVVISGSTLLSGSQLTLGGSTFSLLPSSSGIVVNGQTVPLSALTTANPAPGAPLASAITSGTITGAVIEGVSTLLPGSQVTIAGTTFSLASNGGLVINGQTTVPLSVAAVITPGAGLSSGIPITAANGAVGLVFGSQTLLPGSSITVDGEVLSLNGPITSASALTINGDTITARPITVAPGTTGVVIDGQTLLPGAEITVDGAVLSLLPSGGGLVVETPTTTASAMLGAMLSGLAEMEASSASAMARTSGAGNGAATPTRTGGSDVGAGATSTGGAAGPLRTPGCGLVFALIAGVAARAL